MSVIDFVVWLIVGAIIGWLASSLMGQREGLILNIVVGVVGAFLAGLVFKIPTFNNGSLNLTGLLLSLLGAIALLAVVSVFRRGVARR